MRHLLRNLITSVLVMLMITFLFVFCRRSCPVCPTPSDQKDSVEVYLRKLPSWESFSPTKPDTTEADTSKAKIDHQNKMIRVTTPCSITRTPETIVTYSPSSEILYMGSLIQGKTYLGGLDAIEELPIRQRAPLTISIDLLSDDNLRIVEHPDLASVQQAIGELVAAAARANYITGSSIFFNQTTSHSVEQAALKLGLSAKFMGTSVKASLNWNQSQMTNTVAAYFIQKMFTTSMVIPQKPSDLFSSDFTTALLDEQEKLGRIGSDNLPVFVSNIAWGRMLLLTMTSTFEVDSMKAFLRASSSGISGGKEGKYKNILANSEIRLVTVGGNQSDALEFLQTGRLGSFFEEEAPLTSAVPISYTLRNLGDNSVARISETTKYNMVEDKPFEIEVLADEVEWINSVQSLGFHIIEWETNAANVSKAKEVDTLFNTKNQALGAILTFEDIGAESFSFQLINTAPNLIDKSLGLIYWDKDGKTEFPEGTISIGDIDNYYDDDFDIRLMGLEVYATAFEIGENKFTEDEILSVYYSVEGDSVCKAFSNTELSPFIGIISPFPLVKIHFDESDDKDDIYVEDFKFGILK